MSSGACFLQDGAIFFSRNKNGCLSHYLFKRKVKRKAILGSWISLAAASLSNCFGTGSPQCMWVNLALTIGGWAISVISQLLETPACEKQNNQFTRNGMHSLEDKLWNKWMPLRPPVLDAGQYRMLGTLRRITKILQSVLSEVQQQRQSFLPQRLLHSSADKKDSAFISW